MESTVVADIFKFMALRSPDNPDQQKDQIHYIRDYRINGGITPNLEEDQQKFSKSQVAQYVYYEIARLLPGVTTSKQMLDANRIIADNVKQQFGINEQTGLPWIDEFVAVMKSHVNQFDKQKLTKELDDVVKKQFNDSNLKDYANNPVEGDASRFQMDYETLFDRLYALYICKRNYPLNLEYVLNGIRTLHVVSSLVQETKTPPHEDDDHKGHKSSLTNHLSAKAAKTTINSQEDLAELFWATPSIHPMLAYLIGYYKPFNDIKPVGIGDLLVAKQFLCKYEAGEIAHVENVLIGESFERSHRTLDRREDTYVTESEIAETNEKDLQTTGRFEMKEEAESTIQEDLSSNLSMSVSGSYGTVEYSTTAGVSYSQSKNDSIRSASNFSKDIVNRSLNRIQKRVREERTVKRIYETEEINKHGFNNVGGNENIAGIYRWLDKHYKGQVYNYGKRLMFEFVIPEPAAFIKMAFEQIRKKPAKPVEPIAPVNPSLVISQITETVADQFAQTFTISDLNPMPASTKTVSKVVQATNVANSTGEFSLDLPAGYKVENVRAVGFRRRDVNTDSGLFVTIGGETKLLGGNEKENVYKDFDETYNNVTSIEDKLAIAVGDYGVPDYAFNLVVTLTILPEKVREWQLKTYSKIMAAYEKKLAEYKSELYDYQEKLANYEANADESIKGHNPRINLDIIKTELKKHCITMFSKQFDSNKADDIDFGTMGSRSEVMNGTNVSIPAIDIQDTRNIGPHIQFLEQAFEWTQISYLLYPYFWAEFPEKWFEAQTYFDEADPVYAKFLQAGSARVLVSVRPAYEVAVLHYLYTQEPWNGGEAPSIDDPMYLPIYAELRNQQDDLTGSEPYGDPWEFVVPTSLVYLQKTSDLPTYDCGLSDVTP